MQDIQEGGDRIASRLPNLRLLNKSIVKERDGALLFLVHAAPSIAAFGFFPSRCARDVEPHFRELVSPGRGLLALPRCGAILAVGLARVSDRKFDRDFVATGKVGVGYLRVRDFERGTVLHIERDLSLAELGLAPIPAAQRVFLVLKGCAVPVLEDFAEAFIVLFQVSRYPLCPAASSLPLVESRPAEGPLNSAAGFSPRSLERLCSTVRHRCCSSRG